jgi:hypothetical protein
MVTSTSKGHKTEYISSTDTWVYSDTKEIDDESRPCKNCGKESTIEGHDSCLGELPNVQSACCGHGIEKPYAVDLDGNHFKFDSVYELKKHFNGENKYQKLNIKELLKNRETKIISYEEAIKDIIPIDWSDDVLSGKVKVEIK